MAKAWTAILWQAERSWGGYENSRWEERYKKNRVHRKAVTGCCVANITQSQAGHGSNF
jgi:hypothetical protein